MPDRGAPASAPDEAGEPGRGRTAETPTDVPKAGWLDVLSRTAGRISSDNMTLVAAGAAFYAFVALVPTLAALIGIYGLVFDPAEVGKQVTSFARILPREVLPLLEQQLRRITLNSGAAGLSAVLGVLVALWTAASATKGLIQGLNIGYAESEKRGFIKLNVIALILTVGVILGASIAVALVAVLPAVLVHLSFGPAIDAVLKWARWPVLLGGFTLGLAIMYRYGPSREDAKWRWVSPGAVASGILWVIGSGLFSLYASRFGSYDKTYGSLGAVVVFLMWLYLSAFVVLLGAELNSELERQTVKDTTDGPPKPLGERGAYAADSIGPARKERAEPKARPPTRPRTGT